MANSETKPLKKALRNELGFKDLNLPKKAKNNIKRHQFAVINSYQGGDLQVVGILVDTIVLGSTVEKQKLPILEAKAKEILARYS